MTTIDRQTLKTFDESLQRCTGNPRFLDRFYEIFLASSPKVRDKFAATDFERQQRALRASLYMIVLAATGGASGPAKYLEGLAERHGRSGLNVGAELYDLWLDSLIAAARECDSRFDRPAEQAWESVMGVGIKYLLERY